MQVDVSGSKFNFPQQCACCGGAPQTAIAVAASRSTGKKVVHTTTKFWDFPYCLGCVEHVKTADTAIAAAIFIVVVSLLAAGYFYFFAAASGLAALVGIGGIVTGVVAYASFIAMAKTSCNPNCACLRRPVKYLGWQSTYHMFEIISESYAFAFMMENKNKLVNVRPEVWQWLHTGVYVAQPTQSQSARRSIS